MDGAASSRYNDTMKSTRYEKLIQERARQGQDRMESIARASITAREAQEPSNEHEDAIVRVAAGVAAPTLVGYVLWVFREAAAQGLHRLCFLSRDGQVMYEVAKILSPRLGYDFDLHYIYSSRLTWSLAASDPYALSKEEWLFNSFVKSNAGDVCARLGIDAAEFRPHLVSSGVDLRKEARADSPRQLRALQTFVDVPEVSQAVAPRIEDMRELVAAYATQYHLVEPETGLVDSGWTGRMVGSLIKIMGDVSRPRILFWGHEPRASGWTDDSRVAAYMYNSARRDGMNLRVPDAPFLVESFCMADHGIVSGYRWGEGGLVEAELQSATNIDAIEWGIDRHRATIYAFCDAFDAEDVVIDREVVSELMHLFWVEPTRGEAEAWGSYTYDSDPAATAPRTLARPFPLVEVLAGLIWHQTLDRGDRAWTNGSVAMSTRLARLLTRFTIDSEQFLGRPAGD